MHFMVVHAGDRKLLVVQAQDPSRGVQHPVLKMAVHQKPDEVPPGDNLQRLHSGIPQAHGDEYRECHLKYQTHFFY